jgi:serine/threonine protein kinase
MLRQFLHYVGCATSRQPRRIDFRETLGRGGFGAVYLADVYGENDFVQRLAVKLLSAEVSEFPDLVARQRDEARLLAQLNHDHIVKVMDLTEIAGRPAILMEYVDGIDANHLYKRVQFPLRAALEAIAAAASALAAAYGTVSPRTGSALHAIHRDIKPSNLLVSTHGGLKVLDFGVARANFDREGATESVQFGTPRFMAPEQWLRGDVGPEVDVYALALTFLSLVTGKEHERLPLDPLLYEDAKRELIAELPPQPLLLDVVDRMLAYEPKRRPSAAAVHEIFTALAEEAEGEGLARFARRVVPPLVAERRERWASDSPPDLGAYSATSLRSTAALPPERTVLRGTLLFASAALALFLVAAMVLAVSVAYRQSHPSTEPVTAMDAQPDADVTWAPVEASPEAPAVETAPVEPAPALPTPKPRPVPVATASTLPAVVEPPPPERASPTYGITVSSLPLGAFRVSVDDVDRGVTPAMKLMLPEGKHTLVLVADDGTRTPPKTITVAKFAPTHWTWNTQTGRWDY